MVETKPSEDQEVEETEKESLFDGEKVLILPRAKSSLGDLLEENDNFLTTPVYLLSVLADYLGAEEVTFDLDQEYNSVS